MRAFVFVIALVLGCAKKDPGPAGAASTAPSEKAPFREMSVADVEQRIGKKDSKVFVFDANPREVYDKRHVPGAIYVPDEGVTASLLPPDKSATLIFYCANTH